MAEPNAFAAPTGPDVPDVRTVTGTAGSVPVALVVAVLGSALHAGLEPYVTAMPRVPLVALWGAVGLLASGILALRWPAAGWPALFAVPVTMIVDLPDTAETLALENNLSHIAFQLVWAATAGAAMSAVWVGVPIARWPAFFVRFGAKLQLVVLGTQFVVPGLVALVALAATELEAGRGSERGWFWVRAVRAWGIAPIPVAVVLIGQMVGWVASLGVWVVAVGPQNAVERLMVLEGLPFGAGFLEYLSYTVPAGLALGWAARRYPSAA